jgi:hypothetical protein
MTSGVPQQSAVASRVERLVERAMTFALDEREGELAVARLAWLARDDQAALEEAGVFCLERTEVDLAVRGRAAGLLARVRHQKYADRTAGSARSGPARQPGTSRGPRRSGASPIWCQAPTAAHAEPDDGQLW